MHVLTRSAQARELALELGAASAGAADDAPPEPLDAAILFAPAGELVPGGAAARWTAAARWPSPASTCQRHPAAALRRRSCSRRSSCAASPPTPAPTARSSCALAAATARPPDGPTAYPLDEADRALADLAADRVTGAAVLTV